MSQQSFEPVLGLEISDDYLLLAKLEPTPEGPQVADIKSVPVPPKSIINGEILDFESLGEVLLKTLDDMEIRSMNVVASLSGLPFVKRVDRLPDMSSEELRYEVDERLIQHHMFSGDEFESGFQVRRHGDSSLAYCEVLYAAQRLSAIDGLHTLLEMTDLRLFAVDVLPLAWLRGLLEGGGHEGIRLVLTLDKKCLDLMMLKGEDVLYSHTLWESFEGFSSHAETVDLVMQRLSLFLLSFSNVYPTCEPLSQVVLCTREEDVLLLEERLQSVFSEANFERYHTKSNLNFRPQLLVGDRLNEEILACSPAIGLGLKYFERFNTSLSLISVKRQLAPVFDRVQVLTALGAFIVGVFIVLVGAYYLDTAVTRLGVNIAKVDEEISELKSGEFLNRQNRLEQLRTRISAYNGLYERKYSKTEFLNGIIQGLSEDITFDSISMDTGRMIQVKGSALFQDSIYEFYNRLKASYKDVKIVGITVDNRGEFPVNRFDLRFRWE